MPNFDTRSLPLNFEVAVAMYDSKIALQLERHFEKDIERTQKIELENWSHRPSRELLFENICRLFAPVL